MKKEKDNSKKLLLKGTAILSVAGLLSKVLSAVYRVPFQNIVGDVGFYIYQQVYPFYGIAVSFATYGFPVVISKLYAEKISIGDTRAAKKYYFRHLFPFQRFAFLYSLSFILVRHFLPD